MAAMVALAVSARLSSPGNLYRKIEGDVETETIRGDRQLRPGAPAVRRGGADRRGRARVHDAAAGGDLLPRLPHHGFRHLRTVDVELHGQDRAGQLPLCRHAGVRVADVPPQLHLCAHRPHQEAGRPQGQAGRPAGIPAHRLRLGARHPAGRLRREAVRHHLGARRDRRSDAAGEDHHQAAGRT